MNSVLKGILVRHSMGDISPDEWEKMQRNLHGDHNPDVLNESYESQPYDGGYVELTDEEYNDMTTVMDALVESYGLPEYSTVEQFYDHYVNSLELSGVTFDPDSQMSYAIIALCVELEEEAMGEDVTEKESSSQNAISHGGLAALGVKLGISGVHSVLKSRERGNRGIRDTLTGARNQLLLEAATLAKVADKKARTFTNAGVAAMDAIEDAAVNTGEAIMDRADFRAMLETVEDRAERIQLRQERREARQKERERRRAARDRRREQNRLVRDEGHVANLGTALTRIYGPEGSENLSIMDVYRTERAVRDQRNQQRNINRLNRTATEARNNANNADPNTVIGRTQIERANELEADLNAARRAQVNSIIDLVQSELIREELKHNIANIAILKPNPRNVNEDDNIYELNNDEYEFVTETIEDLEALYGFPVNGDNAKEYYLEALGNDMITVHPGTLFEYALNRCCQESSEDFPGVVYSPNDSSIVDAPRNMRIPVNQSSEVTQQRDNRQNSQIVRLQRLEQRAAERDARRERSYSRQDNSDQRSVDRIQRRERHAEAGWAINHTLNNTLRVRAPQRTTPEDFRRSDLNEAEVNKDMSRDLQESFTEKDTFDQNVISHEGGDGSSGESVTSGDLSYFEGLAEDLVECYGRPRYGTHYDYYCELMEKDGIELDEEFKAEVDLVCDVYDEMWNVQHSRRERVRQGIRNLERNTRGLRDAIRRGASRAADRVSRGLENASIDIANRRDNQAARAEQRGDQRGADRALRSFDRNMDRADRIAQRRAERREARRFRDQNRRDRRDRRDGIRHGDSEIETFSQNAQLKHGEWYRDALGRFAPTGSSTAVAGPSINGGTAPTNAVTGDADTRRRELEKRVSDTSRMSNRELQAAINRITLENNAQAQLATFRKNNPNAAEREAAAIAKRKEQRRENLKKIQKFAGTKVPDPANPKSTVSIGNLVLRKALESRGISAEAATETANNAETTANNAQTAADRLREAQRVGREAQEAQRQAEQRAAQQEEQARTAQAAADSFREQRDQAREQGRQEASDLWQEAARRYAQQQERERQQASNASNVPRLGDGIIDVDDYNVR